MPLAKRLALVSFTLLLVIATASSVLYQKGHFEDPQLALRTLANRAIAPTAASVRKAAARGDAATLELLADAEAPFDQSNEAGETPLLLTLAGKHVNCLPILEKQGWDLDARDEDGRTPLSLALDQYLQSTAETFLAQGASPNFTLPDGKLALPGYFLQGRLDDVQFLLSAGANPNSPADDGQSILALALQKNQPALACKLLQRGADPNGLILGEPVLCSLLANFSSWNLSESDATRILGTLLLSGANFETVTSDGQRPIHIALRENFRPAQELLLPRVADLSGCLWIALQTDNHAALETLLLKGAHPEVIGPTGDTPLIHALRNNDPLLVRTLLSAGASPGQLSPEGQPALFLTLALDNTEAALALISHENAPDLNAVMIDPVSEEFRNLFERRGIFDWYCRNETGLTPLMAATMLRNLLVAESLIELGAEKFQPTSSGVYAIQMAAKNGDVEMQQLLIGVSYHEEDQRRRFVIDLSEQKVTYFRNGEVAKTSRISTGRPGYRTTTGDFVITDKNRHHRSNIYNSASMPYFQRFSCSAIGFHEGNTYSRFASHGCVRLPRSTAQFFWKEAQLGDRITVQP
jgi:ankyrin repeat protein